MDDVSCLRFIKMLQLRQSFEQFSTFYNFGDDVEVFIILQKIDNSDDVRMTLAAEYAQFILKKLNVYLLFLYLLLCHDFDCELFAWCF